MNLSMKRILVTALFLTTSVLAWCQSEWYGVYIKDKKAGYVTFDQKDDARGHYVESVSVLGGKILGSALEIKVTSRTWSNARGELTRMEVDSQSGGKVQKMLAVVSGGKIEASSTMDGRTTKKTIEIPAGAAIIDDPMTMFMKGDAPREVYVIDSNTLGLVKCSPVNLGTEKLKTAAGEVEATVIDMQDPRSPLKVYLSKKGDVLKAVGPFGMEIRPVTKAVALGASDGADIADASSVTPNHPIPDFLQTKTLTLKISGHDLGHIPSDAHQTVSKKGDSWVLTIHPVQPDDVKVTSGAAPGDQWTKPDQRIPSDSARFRKQAKEIVGTEHGLLERVEKLRTFVQGQVRANAGIGVLRDADDILDSGEGVCRDHAILLATLLRADDIPTRLVSGMVYANGAFYYHAWVEVWTGSGWMGVDSTRPTKGLDATHIKVAEGTVSDVFTSFLLDGISIEVVDP